MAETNTLGNVKKYKKNKGHESISRNMLQDEDNLSIGAIGLLSNLISYPDTWKLYKTELYTRFKKSKRTQIQNAWNELVEEKYIIQLRKRNGKKFDYIYYFQEERFTESEIKEICEIEKAEIWDGKNKKKMVKTEAKDKKPSNVDFQHPKKEDVSDVDFQQSILDSPKPTDNIDIYKEINYKDKEDINIDTYKDTEKRDLSTKREKERMLKESLKSDIPPLSFNTLSIFSEDFDEMYKWIGIIFRAKDKLYQKRNDFIILEEIDEELNQMLISGIRAIKKNTKIKEKDGYLFKTIYNGLEKVAMELSKQNSDEQESLFETV